MERNVRRIMCLTTKKDRRKRRNRAAATRLRSPTSRNRDRMSVGEVMGLSTVTNNAVNLSEVRAMDSEWVTEVNVGEDRSRCRHTRIKSVKGRAKEHVHTRESRSESMNRCRSTLVSTTCDVKLTSHMYMP